MEEELYKGLNPFTERDGAIFGGRDVQVKLIVEKFKADRVTVVYGESGVGKSSLLQAGVASRLRQQAERNTKKYEVPLLAVSIFWHWDEGDYAKKIIDKIREDIQEISPNLSLHPTKPSLKSSLEAWTKQLGRTADEGKIFVILDQFEDYLSFYAKRMDSAKHFAQELAEAINCFELPVNFIIAIRESAFTQLNSLNCLIPKLTSNCIAIKRLNRSSAKDAICKPIKVYNQNHPDNQIDIDPELVEIVLDQVAVKGGEGIEAPYLQLVMKSIWEKERASCPTRLRKQTLDLLGGTEEITRRHFQNQITNLESEDEQGKALRLLYYLVTPSGSTIEQNLNDLIDYDQNSLEFDESIEKEEAQRLFNKFSESTSRLLRVSTGDRYKIYFDVLAKIVAQVLQDRQMVRELAHKAKKALINFNYSQYQSLEKAIKISKELLIHIERMGTLFDNHSYYNVQYAIQNILENILEKRIYTHGENPIYGISVSADNKLATASFNGQIKIWDLTKPVSEPIENQNPSDSVYYISFAPGGQKLAVAGWDGNVYLWDLLNNTSELLPINNTSAIYCLCFSPDGTRLAAASENGKVYLWDIDRQQLLPHLSAPESSSIFWISFSPDGQKIAAIILISSSSQVCLWNLSEPANPQLISDMSGVSSLDFSPDVKVLALADFDGIVKLLDTKNFSLIAKFKAHDSRIAHVSFAENEQRLTTIAWDGKIRQWDLEQHNWHEYQSNRHPIHRVSFSSNRELLVTAASDGLAHLWSLKDEKLVQIFDCKGEAVFCADWNPQRKQIATASISLTENDKGCIRLWDWGGNLIKELPYKAFRLSFSVDGQYLAVASVNRSGLAYVLDLNNPEKPIPYDLHQKTVYCAVFSPQGNLVASCSEDGEVHLWDLIGQRLNTFEYAGPIYYVLFSPQGQQLAFSTIDGRVHLIDLQGKEQDSRIIGHINPVYCLDFHKNGKILATASADGTACLWDLKSYRLRGQPLRHENIVYWVKFSHDGQLLSTACGNGVIYLWRVEDGQKIAEFKHHQADVFCVSFSPDDRSLAGASKDGTLKLRALESLKELVKRGERWLKE